ncbi:hypothetical protein ACFLRO_00330 [Bacteroidota bacterium]
MRTKLLLVAISVTIVMGRVNEKSALAQTTGAAEDKMDRTVLPIKPPKATVVTEMDLVGLPDHVDVLSLNGKR